ncbi:MAG: DoxX family membrane protein [Chlorobi bacterium]|nr:DoxX family membrane protein [Chlorobiota bacterium]MCI0717300.1 DoxX family membrane protein [Chlorobiota bacterium]
MKKIFENKYFVISARIILGAIFVYASLEKIANPQAFADIINNYRVLPVQLVNPLAVFLPWLELITGLFLMTGKWVKGSLLIYSTLLVIFIIALSQALIRGLDISCGCFSVDPSTTSNVWLRTIEDLIMLFFSVNLYRYSIRGNLKTEKSII